MTKQEFLAMSLPFGLYSFPNNRKEYELYESFSYSNEFEYNNIGGLKYIPILHPLTDLTKEIEHNGEKFVPIEWFEIGDDENNSNEYDSGNVKLIRSLKSLAENGIVNDVDYLPFGVVQKLIKWHFDITKLIKKGEAIDVNTLPENPYK